MQLDLVKAAIRDAVIAAEIPQLDCYAYLPSKPSIPCFYPGEVTFGPNSSFGPTPGGHDTAEITCRVLTSFADDADGQLLLDRYLSRSGPYSIRAALLAARGEPGELALSGTCDDFKISSIDGYRLMTIAGDDTYFGAQINLHVVGS